MAAAAGMSRHAGLRSATPHRSGGAAAVGWVGRGGRGRLDGTGAAAEMRKRPPALSLGSARPHPIAPSTTLSLRRQVSCWWCCGLMFRAPTTTAAEGEVLSPVVVLPLLRHTARTLLLRHAARRGRGRSPKATPSRGGEVGHGRRRRGQVGAEGVLLVLRETVWYVLRKFRRGQLALAADLFDGQGVLAPAHALLGVPDELDRLQRLTAEGLLDQAAEPIPRVSKTRAPRRCVEPRRRRRRTLLVRRPRASLRVRRRRARRRHTSDTSSGESVALGI